MGEWIRNIGELHFGNTAFRVEINEPEWKGGDKLIHVQNEKFRFVMTESEFLQIGTLAMQARENLMQYKGSRDAES